MKPFGIPAQGRKYERRYRGPVPGSPDVYTGHRECKTHTQGKDHERVLGVVARLKRVIPLVEQFDHGTGKADDQRDGRYYE